MRALRRIIAGFLIGFYWPLWNLKHRIQMARLIGRLKGRRKAIHYFVHGVPNPWE